MTRVDPCVGGKAFRHDGFAITDQAGATFALDQPSVEPGLPGSVNMDLKTGW